MHSFVLFPRFPLSKRNKMIRIRTNKSQKPSIYPGYPWENLNAPSVEKCAASGVDIECGVCGPKKCGNRLQATIKPPVSWEEVAERGGKLDVHGRSRAKQMLAGGGRSEVTIDRRTSYLLPDVWSWQQPPTTKNIYWKDKTQSIPFAQAPPLWNGTALSSPSLTQQGKKKRIWHVVTLGVCGWGCWRNGGKGVLLSDFRRDFRLHLGLGRSEKTSSAMF